MREDLRVLEGEKGEGGERFHTLPFLPFGEGGVKRGEKG